MICSPAHSASEAEHEAAHRHRRIAAIVDHLVPVLVAQLGDVHPERGEQIERMARRHPARGQRLAQRHRLGLGFAAAEQFGLEQIEIFELGRRIEHRMVGDVVGGADEIVERQNQLAMPRVDDPRRHRKVLVPVGLAGSQFARRRHRLWLTLGSDMEKRHERTRPARADPFAHAIYGKFAG